MGAICFAGHPREWASKGSCFEWAGKGVVVGGRVKADQGAPYDGGSAANSPPRGFGAVSQQQECSKEPLRKASRPVSRGFLGCCRRRPLAASSDASSAASSGASSARQVTFGADEHGVSSPTLDALDEGKRAKIAELRGRLDALPPKEAFPRRHDLWLKRFLAHCKWKVDQTFELYCQMETWRRQVGADSVLQDYPDGPDKALSVLQMDLIGFYPWSRCKNNRSIAWMRGGHVPWWRALFERTDLTHRAQLWMSEHHQQLVHQRALETGVWMERTVILVDLSALDFQYFQGLSTSTRTRKRAAGQTIAINYPGIVDRAYVLNAPGFANRAWSILKHFLSAALMEKAVMVSSQEEKRQMLDDLGAENVPRALGGTSDAPSAPMPERLRMPPGGWDGVIAAWRPRDICISKGSTHEEVLRVPAGGRCTWQWTLTCASISFQVSRGPQAGGAMEIVEEMREYRFDDVEEPVCGEVAAPAHEGCAVHLRWSNESSMLRSKTLLLRTEVLDA